MEDKCRNGECIVCHPVTCARCGHQDCCLNMIMEEGDEWECPECNERENARERCKHTTDWIEETTQK